MTSLATTDATVASPTESSDLDPHPPGKRYFRHPGDVIRLVLWGAATIALIVFTAQAPATSDGLAVDLSDAAGRSPRAARDLLLALTQLAALAVPIFVVVVLVAEQRWRRLGMTLLAAAAGAAVVALLQAVIELDPALDVAAANRTGWVLSSRFPSLTYLGAVSAAAVVGKPWLGRSWRRACDVIIGSLLVVMVLAGSAGVPALLLAVAAGATAGAGLLTLLGAPNRRPSPAAVTSALRRAGLDVSTIALQRAEGGRSQLYIAERSDGGRSFVKVHSRDSRDADLLYRAYRTALLRASKEDRPTLSLEEEVEHEALLLVLARRGGVTCPDLQAIAPVEDGSMAVALEFVEGRPLSELEAAEVNDTLVDELWAQVDRLHRARLSHRSLHAGNILVAAGHPIIVDLGFATTSADDRLQSIDRAELITSLSTLIGVEPAVAGAVRNVDRSDLAATASYLQPLALSATTRSGTSKAALADMRDRIATTTGEEPAQLERLVRVRPRTLLTVATLAAAFYLLLPQLANVGDSFAAIRNANWAWILVCIAMSGVTYVMSAVGIIGGVPERLPFGHLVQSQLASSFVNRVTPANVGGMALNVRFMQKAGVEPATAVTGMGLNVLAGGVVHTVLLVAFFAWAGRSESGFEIPAGSRVLVIICIVLAALGLIAATTRGRYLLRTHVVTFLARSWRSLVALSKSPTKLAYLFGGSLGVTLAYTCALAAAGAALDAGVTFAEVGALYLGASFVAAAAPTPGGLGAMEAALVAGFTGVGVEPGVAVAVVLSYRLATYWLPILPGWICLHVLERGDLI